MALVYAAPYVPPAPAASKWPGLQITWHAWDGSVWTLTDATSGVYLPPRGVSGLGKPRRERFTSSSPSRAGARPRGTRALPRAVSLSVEVYTDGGSAEWLALDAAFFRTLDADRPGRLRVTQPSGEWRELELRFENDDDHAFVPDPSVIGWEVYDLEFVALDPYWRGEPVVAGPWQVGDIAEPFFPGPPYTIGSSSTAGDVTITNPGDVEAYPIWRAADGVDSLLATVAGQTIEVPFEVPVGSELLIDTDLGVALLDGVDVTEDLAQIGFEPLPAGEPAAVSVEMVGPGEVSCTFTPLYERAW